MTNNFFSTHHLVTSLGTLRTNKIGTLLPTHHNGLTPQCRQSNRVVTLSAATNAQAYPLNGTGSPSFPAHRRPDLLVNCICQPLFYILNIGCIVAFVNVFDSSSQFQIESLKRHEELLLLKISKPDITIIIITSLSPRKASLLVKRQ